MKILHILYNSIPERVGSTIRSESILKAQLDDGLNVIAISSPFQKPLHDDSKSEIINKIKYLRTYNRKNYQEISETRKSFLTRILKFLYIFNFTYSVVKTTKKIKPDIIHAHSMFFCAFAGKVASIITRVPFVYEVRSLWEERLIKTNRFEVFIYNLISKIEIKLMQSSSIVFVINNYLMENLIKRGVDRNKIKVVPNAINDSLVPIEAIKYQKWTGLKMSPLRFGYIGNISEIEGLDVLARSYTKVCAKHSIKNNLKIYGDGPFVNKLKEIIINESLKVDLLGKFCANDMSNVYANVDCIVIPRKNILLTQTVTPIKPLEAMAYKKLCVLSNVGGLKEIAGSEKNAIFFNILNHESLERTIESILFNELSELNSIVENGFKYVYEDRNWGKVAKIYKSTYADLINETKE